MIMEMSTKRKTMSTVLWITLLSFMMFTACVRCTIFPRDNYMIYVYPFFYVDTTDLYVQQGDIPAIASNSHKRTILYHKYGISIQALDMDVENGGMYMFDSHTRCIYHLVFINTPTLTANTKHCGISTSTDVSIAYDWVSKNIYWTDPHFGWIGVQPVGTTDKTMSKYIVQNNNYRPGALAVDPLKGFLFWFDSIKDGERIERSLLSGENRTTIVTTESNCVQDIVADVTSQRIYWVDSCRFAVEYVDYDGNNRNILYRRDKASFHDLAIDKDYICTTLPHEGKLLCINKATGSLKIDRFMQWTSPRTISIFNLEKQTAKTDLCLTKGCEHFCVNNPEGAVCLCKEGYSLNTDKKTCKADDNPFGKSIIISNTTHICKMGFKALTGISQTLKCLVGGLKNVKHLSVDTDDRVIYYTEQTTNTISSYDTTTGSKTALYTTGKVSGLACDWVDKNLYWSESDTAKIRVISIRTKDSKTLLTTNGQPSSLVVDPHNKKLFWIEKSSSSYEIIATSLDGNNRKVIMGSTSLKAPSGLYFNTNDYRLYFLDNREFFSVKGDGSGSSSGMFTGSSDLLVIYKNYALWSTSRGNRLRSVIMDSNHIWQTIRLKDTGKVTGLNVFDPALQPIEKGPCDAFNGGCEHVCIAASGGRTCMCNFGFYLGSDGTSCRSNVASSNFLLASDTTQNKIYQVSLKNGRVVGLDIPSAEKPLSVVFDKRTGSAIWSQSTGHIMKANLDGTNTVNIHKGGYVNPDRLAIDNTNGFLYFSSSAGWRYFTGKISVMDPVSSLTKTLVKNLADIPGLALYPSQGYIFYVHFFRFGRRNKRYSIRRVYMDGTGSTNLIQTSAKQGCLTIDYTSNRLYWIESGNIKSSTLSGNDRKTVVNKDFDISHVLISNGLMYYTAAKLLKVGRYTLSTLAPNEFMKDEPEMGILNSIDVYDESSMPVNDLCKVNRQGCSTFCLPRSSTYKCACEDGTSLTSDGKTCKGVKKCSGSVQNGAWKNDCNFFQYQFCSFTCDTGFIPALSSSRVMCQKDGTWQHDLSILCKVPISSTTKSATAKSTTPSTTTTTLQPPTSTTTKKPTTAAITTSTTTLRPTTRRTTTTSEKPAITTTTQKPTTTPQKPTTTTLKPTTTTTKIPTSTTTTTRKPTTTSTSTTKKPSTTTTTTNIPTTTTTTTTNKPTTTTTTPIPTTTRTTTTKGPTTTTTKKPTTTTKKPTTTTTKTTITTTKKPTTTTTTKKPTTTTTTTTITTTKKPTTTTTTKKPTTTTTTTKPTTTTIQKTTGTTPKSLTTTSTSLEILCGSSINNGELQDTCTRKPGVVCRFTCNESYNRAIVDHTITCLNIGQWSTDPTKLCRLKAAVIPNQSAQKGDSSTAYAGVGGGVSALIIIAVIVVLIVLYLKRRARKDGPKVYMHKDEGFENPSYDSVHYTSEQFDNAFNDGGYVNLTYESMHGSQSPAGRRAGKNDTVSSATTVSSYGGKKQMRDSSYIQAPHDHIAPDHHIYDSVNSAVGVHGRRNSELSNSGRSSTKSSRKDSPENKGNEKASPQRQNSKDRFRKGSHKRPGGVQALQEIYSPPNASQNQGYSPYYYDNVSGQPHEPRYWNTPGQPPRRYSLQYDDADAMSIRSDYSYGKDSTSKILPKKR